MLNLIHSWSFVFLGNNIRSGHLRAAMTSFMLFRIERALDLGHALLQSVFTDMRNEVQKEQKRLVSVFDDTFRLISRILKLQENIAGKIF